MKISVAQINTTVGDISNNTVLILNAYEQAANQGADIVVFPESILTGYPLDDLVLRESFLDAVDSACAEIIEYVNKCGHGYPAMILGTPKRFNDSIMNTALVIDVDGTTKWVFKRELPNYGVFDEKRHFTPGFGPAHPVEIRGVRLGLMICEDCWFPTVSRSLADAGAEILISINGSPFEDAKNVTRRKVVAKRIRETGLPFMYVNAVGGQDELVFDGGSFFYDGTTTQQIGAFEDVVATFNVNIPANRITLDNYEMIEGMGVEGIYRATVLGLRDYMEKQGFTSAVLGYSGGVDSGIVAAIACDAIGEENVHLVRLPSAFSSEHSLSDAADGAERLGAHLHTIPIEPTVDALRAAYSSVMGEELKGAADENIQARARGTILMALSNQRGHLLLTTGNKSEVSVGYSTLYGDMAGGFNPIKDCYKTVVWEMCRWRNQLSLDDIRKFDFLGKQAEVVPEAIITKPPSAELRLDQKDEDSLPPYSLLDSILYQMIEQERSNTDIIADLGADPEVVIRVRRLVDLAEYKRRQAAPGVKITSKLYGRERRYPIVNGWRG